MNEHPATTSPRSVPAGLSHGRSLGRRGRELCRLFPQRPPDRALPVRSRGGNEVARIALPERNGAIWHGYVPGLGPRALYGFRAHGPYAPEQGHRFNPNKLLMDPYARELRGAWVRNQAILGYDPTAPEGDLSFDTSDSAPFVPKSVVVDPVWSWMATGDPFATGRRHSFTRPTSRA